MSTAPDYSAAIRRMAARELAAKSRERKQIKLLNKVDPTVLGGVRLDFDGKRLDDTVSHRLDAIRSLLDNTVL